MKTEKLIRDKKKMILVILILIAVLLVTVTGVHLHTDSVKKHHAEDAVTEVVTDLQKGKIKEADQLLGKKASGTLDTSSMSADTYMKTIVSALGYTSGDADQDAKDSWNDLLKAGGADDTVVKNMKKLDQALKDHVITSYELSGTDLKNDTATVSVEVTGIILLPKVSFASDVQKANEKLADYVNDHMDDLTATYNKVYADPNGHADASMNAQLKKEEMDDLIPAMTKRVKKAKTSEETWTFQVDVSSDHGKIQSVSVSQ